MESFFQITLKILSLIFFYIDTNVPISAKMVIWKVLWEILGLEWVVDTTKSCQVSAKLQTKVIWKKFELYYEKKNIPHKNSKMAYFGFLSGQSILIWARNTLSMIAPLTYVIKKCKTSRKSTILKIWFLFEASWNNKKHKNSNISIKTQDFVLKMSGNYFSWVLGRTLPLWAKMSQVWKYTFLSQIPKPYLEPCPMN